MDISRLKEIDFVNEISNTISDIDNNIPFRIRQSSNNIIRKEANEIYSKINFKMKPILYESSESEKKKINNDFTSFLNIKLGNVKTTDNKSIIYLKQFFNELIQTHIDLLTSQKYSDAPYIVDQDNKKFIGGNDVQE